MALARYEHTGAAPATGLAVGMGSSDLTFTIVSGTNYPTGAVGSFVLCVDAGTATEEKILCSNRSGTMVTVAGGGRGYDGTVASSHNSGSINVTHVLSAAEVDDTSDHIYNILRDDHTQYAKTNGSRPITGTQTFSSGITVAGAATVGTTLGVTGTTTLGVTNASTLTASGAITGTTSVSAALSGTSGRYVGQSNGAPSSGTFSTGDFTDDPTNAVFWICLSGGTPGTWQAVGGQGHYSCLYYRNNAWTTGSGTTNFNFDTLVWDPLSAYQGTNHRFLAPIAGVWRFDSMLWAASSGSVGKGQTFQLLIGANGGTIFVASDNSQLMTSSQTYIANLTANQAINTLYTCSTAGLTGGVGTSAFFAATYLGVQF